MIPVYGVHFAMLFWPWFNKKGLVAGGIISLAAIMWLCIGQYFTDTINQSTLPVSTEKCIMGGNRSIAFSNETIHDYHAQPTATPNMDMNRTNDVTHRIYAPPTSEPNMDIDL